MAAMNIRLPLPCMSPRSFRTLLVGLIFCGAAASSHAGETFRKVLFLGNSITKHGPKADIGWEGNWGMAASAEARDYVHLVAQKLAGQNGHAPEIHVKNIAEFERAHAVYDVSSKLWEAIAFQPDLIILAIGENVPSLKTPEDQTAFRDSVIDLLRHIKGTRQPTVIVRSSFWANPAKDTALQQACTAVGGVFVDIGSLGQDERNYARSERSFQHDGVARHPGDRGMAAIADALLKALPKSAEK
jgi:lysophospholipase L1-like esterase